MLGLFRKLISKKEDTIEMGDFGNDVDEKDVNNVKIVLDGDKGMWTLEEVVALLKDAGVNHSVTKKDGDTDDTEVVSGANNGGSEA